tara:strand:- start:364 stop:627 length:264 start_codon:yes stop_codon:yes gene_type:complete
VSNENIRAWVLQMLEQGRATCHPAGTHVVPEPMHSFEDRLNACRDIGELEGFANRRRFDPSQPKWLPEQRNAILLRKMEMQNKRKKK